MEKAPEVQSLLFRWLRMSPRPPLDTWFSGLHKEMPRGTQGKTWEALDKEVRSLIRRLVLGTPGAKEKMALWTRTDLDRVLAGCFRGPSPELPAPDDPRFSGACGLPPWLESNFHRRIEISQWTPKQVRMFLEGLQTRPGLHLRLDRDSQTSKGLLEAEGFALEPGCPGGWIVRGSKSIYETRAWKEGRVEIQDLGSQLAGLKAGVRPGMRVWDLCAGEGGKTLLLSGELRGKGGIWGTDIYPGKVSKLKDRAKRAGVQNLRALVWDGETFPDTPETEGRLFDVVVVDAPCSASGTWRRDPEASLRLFPGDLPALAAVQKKLLNIAWQRLRPGGRLVYITCSWLPEENEDVFIPFVGETGARLEEMGILGSPAIDSNTFFAGIALKP